MANPLEIYEYLKRGAEQRAQQGKQDAVNRLLGQTLTAPDPAQRDDTLRTLTQADPQTGYALQQQFQQQAQATQDRQQKAATGLARAWLSTANAPPEQRQNFYNTFIVPQSRSAGLQPPEQYDPESLDQSAKAYVAMTQSGQSAQPYTLSPGAKRFDSNNTLVAEAPLQNKPHYDAARGGFVTMSADNTPAFTPVPGVMPKPDPTQIITPYQQAQLSLGQQRLALDRDTRGDANTLKQSAMDVKNSQTYQTKLARHREAVDNAQNVLDSIERLEKSKGYAQLGTYGGHIPAGLPYNDVRDSQSQLDTIKGQIALTTMSRLKALSSQGATGFGALSQKELTLLEDSIAALKNGISHAQIEQSLGVIKGLMTKATQMKPPAQYSVGQIVVHKGKKYRVTGGDLDDPNLDEVK